jgi:hypothetical protein
VGGTYLTYAVLSHLEGWLVFRIQDAKPPIEPFIVKIIDPPSDIEGLGEVLLGALGLTGAIVLGAVLLGAVVGGLMFWVRSRQASE